MKYIFFVIALFTLMPVAKGQTAYLGGDGDGYASIQVGESVGIDPALPGISISPHPVNRGETVMVQHNYSKPVRMEVWDMTGKKRIVSQGKRLLIPFSFDPGLYILILTDGQSVLFRGKLVIQE